MGGKSRSANVVVVGAGVSGCACAATLAFRGAGVVLLNPSLDHVGEPCFGPWLLGGGAEGELGMEVVASLPKSLEAAWMMAGMRGGDGSVVVDRRLLSIETKRVLEKMDGLELRQGLVVGLEADRECEAVTEESGGTVRVESAFGETLAGDAVVLAVGLGLGGTTSVRGRIVGAGRYGEPGSGELLAALEGLGAEFRTAEARVGARFAGETWKAGRGVEGRGDRERGEVPGEGCGAADGIGYGRLGDGLEAQGGEAPPSPYEEAGLWVLDEWAWRTSDSGVGAVAPDGVATGEVAVSAVTRNPCSGGEEAPGWGLEECPVETRPGELIEGLYVSSADETGRLERSGRSGGSVWVTGRMAGAGSYLESLAAGRRTGHAVADALGCGDCLGG